MNKWIRSLYLDFYFIDNWEFFHSSAWQFKLYHGGDSVRLWLIPRNMKNELGLGEKTMHNF